MMCDEVVMVDGIGTIFLGGPPLVRAATGEVVSDEDLGGAKLHTETSGCADALATDEADAIALANDTDYGLVAGVWSRDGSRAIRVARQIMVGQVFVNAYGAGGGIELPFGGMKKSGHGREKGFDALYEFAATRTMVIRHD